MVSDPIRDHPPAIQWPWLDRETRFVAYGSALPEDDLATSRRLDWIRLIGPYWPALIVAFLAMLVEAGADLLEPWPLKIIFDHVLANKPVPAWLARWPLIAGDRIALLDAAAVAVVAIALVGAIASYAESYLSTAAGLGITHALRRKVYHHLHRLSLSFYEQRKSGELVARLTGDVDTAYDFISSALLGGTFDVLLLAGMLAVMFSLDWRFTFVSLAIVPPLFFVVYTLTRRIKVSTRDARRQETEIAAVAQEALSSMRTIKAFAAEEFEERRLDETNGLFVRLAMHARSLKARLSPVVDVIVAIGTGLVLFVGVRLVISGRITTGSLLVFIVYVGKMYKPMRDLSKMSDTLSKSAVAIERIEELLDTRSSVRSYPDAQRAPRFAGRLEFSHVRFGYVPEHPVLRDISFRVAPGRIAALVGPSGSGKSTLIALIPRLYDVTAGVIRVDDTDIRRYTLQSLREQVSFVLQEPVLFHTSVWRNIAYGKSDARRDEVEHAATLALAHDFIVRLPQGYDTVIGERGNTLSVGERQRLSIARAILRDSPILLLDEPSSALDAESEALVFAALERVMAGRTCIIIAHRLVTARRADVIFVLEAGQIVDSGTHEELLARGGLYAHLTELQLNPGRRA